MDLTTYKKRSGTSDQGKEYEWLLCTYYSLKFGLNSDISDFNLYTNNEFFGDFDDVVLRAKFKDGTVKVFLLQSKHAENKRNVTLNSLTSENGDFSLFEYKKSYEKTLSLKNFYYILYTSKMCKFKDKTCVDFGNDKLILRHSKCVGRNLLNTCKNQNSVYCFESGKSGFFENFYMYTNQQNVTNLHQAIADLLQNQFQTDIKSLLVEFMRTWWAGNFKLTKSDIIAKLTELVLSPMIQTVTCDINNDKTRLLETAIMKFDLTHIEQNGDKITQIWTKTLQDQTMKTVSMAALKYGLVSRGIAKLQDLSLEKQSKVAWYMNLWPLIVKIDETKQNQVGRILNIVKQSQRKIVLLGDFVGDFPEVEVFRNLSDLLEGDILRSAILKTFKCSLQGKEEVSLENLGPPSVFFVKELVEIATSANFNFGESLETLPPTYIPRSFPKIVLDYKVIDDLKKQKICLSCNGQKDNFRQKISKRMVKITSIVTGFSDFPKHYIYYHDENFSKETIEERYRYYGCDFLFRVLGQNIQWVSSRDSIKELVKYVKPSSEVFTESQIDDNFQNNIKILTSHTGSGKTSLLKSVKRTALSNFFVMKFDLREHSEAFKSEREKSIWEYVTDFYTKSQNYNNFETRLVKNFPKNQTLILWDSFDELLYFARKNFIKSVKRLRKLGVSQWITSKNHFRKILEEEFRVFALTMIPFQQTDQIYYLQNRCGVDQTILEENFLKNVQILDNQEYLGVPLQLYIISDIFNKNPKLLETVYTLTDMFSAFIEGKYQHFLSKSQNYAFLNSLIEDSKEYRLDQYKIAAVKTFLPQIFTKLSLKNTTRFLEDIQNGDFLGLILRENQDGGYIFEYQILGEYLTALFLTENCQIGLEFLYEPKYQNIRFLFDLIMAENKAGLISILYKKFDENVNCQERDRIGRNPLHLMCSYGEKHPLLHTPNEEYNFSRGDFVKEDSQKVKEFVKNLTQKCDIWEKDCVFNWTCFDYADRSLSLGLLEVLSNSDNLDLPKLSNFNDLPSVLYYSIKFNYENLFVSAQKDITFVEDTSKTNLLHVATEFGREKFLTWLLTQKIYIKSINKGKQDSWTPIQIASFNGNLTFLKFLQEKGATFPLRDPSLVSLATSQAHRHVLDFLMECDCSPNDFYHYNYFTRSLPMAISRGYVEIVKFLLDNGAKFYNVGKNNANALHMALEYEQFEIAEILIDRGIDIDATDGNGLTSYHHAAQNNQKTVTEWLLKRNANFRILDEKNRNALHWAAHSGSLTVAQVLVDAGIDIDVYDNEKFTPLHLAVLSGQKSLVEFLLSRNCDPNPKNLYNRTPLHLAAMNDLAEILTVLLNAGADLEGIESLYGRTALHLAAWFGHDDCIKTLLSRDGKQGIDNFGFTPLHLAEEYECCRLLLQAGARIDVQNRNETTPLDLVRSFDIFMLFMEFDTFPIHRAVTGYKFVGIPEIISRGFDVNQFDNHGMSPLHLAVNQFNSYKIVKTLLHNGADINQKNKDGLTALHLILQSEFCEKDTFELFLTEDLINSKSVKGITPLHIAAQGGTFNFPIDNFDSDFTQLLITNGANIEATDDDGFTPLHFAAQSGNLTIVKLLIRDNVNCVNKYNRTPLHMAANKGHHKIVKFLLENGAKQIEDIDGDTPLTDALRTEKPYVVKLLTTDLTVTNDKQRNILHMAAKQGLLDLVMEVKDDSSLIVEDISGSTPLEEALYNRHFDIFDILDQSKFDVNKYSKKYKIYPMHVVTTLKKLDRVEQFLKMGARINVWDEDGNTPLHYPVIYLKQNFQNEREEMLLRLSNYDKSCLNIQNNKGKTVLHLLAKEAKCDLIKKLVALGADINLLDNESDTVFDILFNESCLEETVLYKLNKVDLEKKNRNGATILHLAIEKNNLKTVQWLLNKGASFEIQDGANRTSLGIALRNYNEEMSRLLLKKGAVVKESHLLIAVQCCRSLLPDLLNVYPIPSLSTKIFLFQYAISYLDTLKCLWDKFPDFDITNIAAEYDGKTPLHAAVKKGDQNFMLRLLKRGVRVNEVDANGITPADIAAEEGYLSLLTVLLEYDKNAIFRSNSQGHTLLHIAASKGNLEIVKFLVKKGFRVEVCNREGETAEEMARKKKHLEVCRFLERLK